MDADKRITFAELMSIFSGSDLAVSLVQCRKLPAKRPLKSARDCTEIRKPPSTIGSGDLLTAGQYNIMLKLLKANRIIFFTLCCMHIHTKQYSLKAFLGNLQAQKLNLKEKYLD